MEMASHHTGSMIIWDTGEYEVLPYRASEERPETDDDSASDVSNLSTGSPVSQQPSGSQRLKEAFQNVRIYLLQSIHLHQRWLTTKTAQDPPAPAWDSSTQKLHNIAATLSGE